MTSVLIHKENNLITCIEIKGHALFNEHGKDIVCAGISSIVFGACNALEELTTYDENQIEVTSGCVKIPDIKNDERMQLVCEVMIVQMETIKRSYPKYIEIAYL